MLYQLTVDGTGYAGDTNFPNANTQYRPLENFMADGTGPNYLAVENGLLAGNATTGQNALDVGFYLGSPTDANGIAGETLWASNSAMHRLYQELTGANDGQLTGIDEVVTTYDPTTRTLVLDVDPNTALQSSIDNFLPRSGGVLALPREVVGGHVEMTFAEDFSTVSGTAVLLGTGYVEPGSFAESFAFSGVLIDGTLRAQQPAG